MKRAIPDVPKEGQPRFEFDKSVKETLEILTGRRTGRIKALPPTASQDEIISKINEIIERLQ